MPPPAPLDASPAHLLPSLDPLDEPPEPLDRPPAQKDRSPDASAKVAGLAGQKLPGQVAVLEQVAPTAQAQQAGKMRSLVLLYQWGLLELEVIAERIQRFPLP